MRPERRSPPVGAGEISPLALKRATQRTALAMLTPKRLAAALRDMPAFHHRLHDTFAKIVGKRHPRRLLPAAGIINQIKANSGIPPTIQFVGRRQRASSFSTPRSVSPWPTAAKCPRRSRGSRACATHHPNSAPTGVLSAAAKAFIGPISTRTCRSAPFWDCRAKHFVSHPLNRSTEGSAGFPSWRLSPGAILCPRLGPGMR